MTSRAKSTSVVRLGVPSRLTRPPEARRGERLRVAAGMAAHLADQVHAVAAGELADPRQHVVLRGVERDVGAHGPGQLEPRGLKSLAMTSDAPAARATPTAKQPIGPQPSTSTVLPGDRPPRARCAPRCPSGP